MIVMECCVCYENYNHNNFSLFCSHSLCVNCFKKLQNKICPYCRRNLKIIGKLSISKYFISKLKRHLQYKFSLPLKRINKPLREKYKLLKICLVTYF